MKKVFIILSIIAVVSIVGITFSAKGLSVENYTVATPVSAQSPSDLPSGDVKEYEIQKGDTFADLMLRQGVPYEEALSIIDASKEVFDFTKVGAGKLLKLVFVNQAFAAMEYQLNSDSVVHVKKDAEGYTVTEEDIQYQVVPTVARGTIKDSLFGAAKEADVEDKVILKLADVFSWDVDFATDIREGDSFSIVYEKRSLDGKPAGAGKLLSAEFVNDGKSYTAYSYNDKYYDGDGKSLARQFVKSPLSYTYISSGYSNYRVNPVTKKEETHLAIDYAAPAGTPIIATGKGEVSYAATKGGLGITVEIKHGGSYVTQYAHMSKIAKGIKNGVSVKQGEVIGYVGSTGISTGPHLQYAMFKNGAKTNPLSLDFSREESLNESEMSDFNQTKNKLLEMIK